MELGYEGGHSEGELSPRLSTGLPCDVSSSSETPAEAPARVLMQGNPLTRAWQSGKAACCRGKSPWPSLQMWGTEGSRPNSGCLREDFLTRGGPAPGAEVPGFRAGEA